MITMSFHVPIYNIDVKLVQLESTKDIEKLESLNKWIKFPPEEFTDIKECLKKGYVNGGDTWRNLNARKILIDFFPFTSKTIKTEVFYHEKRHLEDRILEHAEVHDIESAALLAGFLGVKFEKFYRITEK